MLDSAGSCYVCGTRIHAKNLCQKHYRRLKTCGDPLATKRPFRNVLSPDLIKSKCCINDAGCWVWADKPNEDGYGRLSVAQEIIYAHRASYMAFYGEIEDGLRVLHRCDNPPCVNPQHLFLGTQLDNIADMVTKGRHRQGGGKKL